MIKEIKGLQIILDWFNSNQGVLTVGIFLIGCLGAALKYTFLRKRESGSTKVIGNVLNNSTVVAGNNNMIVNFLDSSKIEKMITEGEANLKSILKTAEDENKYKPEPEKQNITTEDFLKAKKIMSRDFTAENFSELQALFYSTNDRYAGLQAVLGLVNWFNPLQHSLNDFIELCDQGIRISEEVKGIAEKAVLLSHKGFFASFKFTQLDIEGAFNIRLSNSTGIPFITEEERKKIIREVQYLDELAENCFRESERLALESKNYKVLVKIYILVGNAAGMRFTYMSKMGLQRAQDEKNLCKRAFNLAKEISVKTDDEHELGYVFHNFANQLRMLGENNEAETLIGKAKEIATKYNDLNLSKMSDVLLKRIKSGVIPDYLHGET